VMDHRIARRADRLIQPRVTDHILLNH